MTDENKVKSVSNKDLKEEADEDKEIIEKAVKELEEMGIEELTRSRLNARKMSIGMSTVPCIRGNEDILSNIALECRRPILVYEPTYQLEPSRRFSCPVVERIINNVLDNMYEGHRYNVNESTFLAVIMAETIMRETKRMLFNRYRILTIVTIGQKKGQSYNNAICFMWDPLRDAYVDVNRDNVTSFIQVTVFGIYLD